MFKIEAFQVRNYKSIVDSGKCFLAIDLTILAGKNESGKTSVLEALFDFDDKRTIDKRAIPVSNQSLIPEIDVTFICNPDDTTDIAKELHLTSSSTISQPARLTMRKTFPSSYSIVECEYEKFGVLRGAQIPSEIFERIDTLIFSFESFATLHIASRNVPVLTGKQDLSQIGFYLKAVTDFLNVNRTALAGDAGVIADQLKLQVADIEQEILPYVIGDEALIKELLRYVPVIVLFSSFEDEFPDSLKFEELEENSWASDLRTISKFDSEKITRGDARTQKIHKLELENSINGPYKKFWKQDFAELSIDWNNEVVNFWIMENDIPFEPSRRSKGRQWHLSFYVRVTAQSKQSISHVILIDEPGLYLHAVAQKDVLGNLLELSREAQVIFSTHSPYLIDVNELHRVRLIEKEREFGTTIQSKIHKSIQRDTLLPILTAIGNDLSLGVDTFNRKHNVVVEGPSDVFYLSAFLSIMQKDDINVIIGGGPSAPLVASILMGWGCRVIVLGDNDKAFSDVRKSLLSKWGFEPRHAVALPLESGSSIEDVFSERDFLKFVLSEEYSTCGGLKNSQFLRNESIDKVLVAKRFLELVKGGNALKLDPETLANMSKLVEIVTIGLS